MITFRRQALFFGGLALCLQVWQEFPYFHVPDFIIPSHEGFFAAGDKIKADINEKYEVRLTDGRWKRLRASRGGNSLRAPSFPVYSLLLDNRPRSSLTHTHSHTHKFSVLLSSTQTGTHTLCPLTHVHTHLFTYSHTHTHVPNPFIKASSHGPHLNELGLLDWTLRVL